MGRGMGIKLKLMKRVRRARARRAAPSWMRAGAMALGVLLPLVLLLSALLVTAPGFAQAKDRPAGPPIDRVDLEAFLDDFFVREMDELHIPGAVFVMVKDGEIFLAKGYGYANVEKGIPVDPERTLFRVGSISKLFTSTAVMQLAERGLLELDEDVNKYVDAPRMDASLGGPVTLSHLLTHTGGFDERVMGTFAKDRSSVVPVARYLAEEMPRQVRAPGEFFQYSNHGMTLAGYVVERVSGIPFSEYVDQNILKPLGMENSGFDLDPANAPGMAVGYRYGRQGFIPEPFDYCNVGPAGQLAATGTDMARFMVTHLQGGRYGDVRILGEDTAREMHSRHFSYHDKVPGMAYGFIEGSANGMRTIGHGGDVRGFCSEMTLIPDHNIGLFVSTNSNAGSRLCDHLVESFVDRYFPYSGEAVPAEGTAERTARLQSVAGSYRTLRYPRDSMIKLISLLDQLVVTAGDDGTIVVRTALPGPIEPETLVEIEPYVFERSDHKGYAAVIRAEAESPTHLALGAWTWEKVPWYESAEFHFILVAAFSVTFLIGLLTWLIGFFVRRIRPRVSEISERGKAGSPWLARHLAGVACGLNLAFFAGAAVMFQTMYYDFAYGIPSSFVPFLMVPLATTGLTVLLTVTNALALARRRYGAVDGVYYSVLNLVLLLFIPFLRYWNLLGVPR